MLEMLLNPLRSERRPWELFFIGIFYASLSVLLVNWIFSPDPVLSRYSGIFIVMFAVIFSMPFVYHTLKIEERKSSTERNTFRLLKEHARAIESFMWLFIGLTIAFSFWYIAVDNPDNYRAQIETYCQINNVENFDYCISEYGFSAQGTGFATSNQIFTSILINNLYVLIFTIIFSFLLGAGGIFILAWNSTVISAATLVFAKSDLYNLPIALARYLIHGLPEIGAYFIGTLAGGIVGISIIRKEFKTEKFWDVLHDSLLLIMVAIILLVFASLVEVYITPKLFF